jgi:predicted transcriptional regulator of viral defense system
MSRKVAGISRKGRAEITLITGRGRRLVSVAEVATALEVDKITAAKRLARWTTEGWLRRVRRGLYIPVPIEADDPGSWSEDALVLADAVWGPCYFTGWTAANHWGLTEQIFRTTVLKTVRRVRSARERLLDHEYLVAHVPGRLMGWGLRPVWREERRLSIADPARTVIDILDAPRLGGGIRQVTEILAAYLMEHDWRTLIEYGDRLGNRTVFKRLGFLVEAAGLGSRELVAKCRDRISAGVSLLDPGGPKRGKRVGEWGIQANVRVTQPGAS